MSAKEYALDAKKSKGNNDHITDPLPTPMVVTAATDGRIETAWVYENCPITVSDRTFLVDLICVHLKSMDVILGMDWLSANSVYLGCKKKIVFIPPENMAEGEVISASLDNS
ncbi:hypothetical protein L195_g041871 [Trifolium pratense]|uniref:Gag-pol polyprotein n=2 Tax=Trifolium pratense TaxID=57577 RepID=A0A2K3M4T0_TRIPR|nr:hypothetical protein L195_g041871 [Trifolium pratense]